MNNSVRLFQTFTGIVIITVIASTIAFSQAGYYFGQNKVQYKKFNWAVFRTEHFDVHYYGEEEQTARDAARMAERGYDYLSEVLDHQFDKRIPLILYSSMNDFQQTNVVSGLIGEGTRGVTEGLKNRVVLPITGSYRDFNHVLVHELVHAFQFDIMFGKKNRLSPVRFNPPLWFVEGMAEYLSIGMDNTTRMWVRDGLMNDNLLTVKQLNTTFDIRVYRLGESLWNYIGEKYGKEMVGRIFKHATRSGNIETAIQKNLGLNYDELTEAWHEYVKALVLPSDSTLLAPSEIAEKVSKQRGYYHRMNILPSVSPDGRSIAYIANKNLLDDLYIIHEYWDGEIEERRIVKGGQSKNFEALRFFDSSIGWSPDGDLITFVAKDGEKDVIYILDPWDGGDKKRKLVFKNLNGILSPAFSPTGEQLVFVGIVGGQSNLYIVDITGKNLRKLTNDRFADLQPQWSPDGKQIVFITDRGKGTDISDLLFGDYDLALYSLETGDIKVLTHLEGSTTAPQWLSGGEEIAFVSDHQGIPNVYKLNLETGDVSLVIGLMNGVAGITESTPAMSWSANGNVLVFSAFENTHWHIYKKKFTTSGEITPERQRNNELLMTSTNGSDLSLIKDETIEVAEEEEQPSDSLWLPAFPDPNNIISNYELEDPDEVQKTKYRSKFNLDAVAFSGGYDTYYGAGGDAIFLFTDMLGNHTFYAATQLQFNSLLHSNFGLTYFNQAHRINFGLQLFQTNYSYLVAGGFNSLGYVRNTYRGFNGIVSFPFSRFRRIEFFGGYTWVDQDFVEEIYTPVSIDRNAFDIGIYKYAQVGAALVFDNSLYGPLGPMSGRRSRISVETTTSDIKFTNVFLDYRRYMSLGHRTVLAGRFLGGASLGEDAQIFSIGGPFTYRGADYDAFVGTKFFLTNIEYRFPLMFFLPPSFDFLSVAVFYDAAAAWGLDIPGFSKTTFKPFNFDNGFRLEDLNSAVGFGFRFNLGYFLLQYDLAWPTNIQGFDKMVTKFSLGTFF